MTTYTLPETLAMLCAPFAPELHQWKGGRKTKDQTKTEAYSYIDARAYSARLDAIAPDWFCDFETMASGALKCYLTIGGITRASCSDVDEQITVMEAQAFKRACAMFGLGRYLYFMPKPWLALKNQKYIDDKQLPNVQRVAQMIAQAVAALDGEHAPAPTPAPSTDAPTLNKERASNMHKEMGKLGIASKLHKQLAERVLNRPVHSFTELTEHEASAVYQHAKREAGHAVAAN